MSLETLPVNSPWRDQIKDWQYPNGKSEYLDGKQSPEEILELMRDSVRAKVEADEAEEEMSDEELETLLAQLLDEEEKAAENEYDDEDEEEEDEEGEADEPVESYEVEDEEDDLDDDLIADDDDGEEEEEEDEEYDEEEEEVDPEQVAAEIAELKEQIESFRFSNISDEDTEE
jgi:hypothetical protein